MTLPTFDEQRAAWRRIPVDDVGYLDARDLLALPDAEFDRLANQAHVNRFTGWRNPQDREGGGEDRDGRWVELLGLNYSGRSVLDFGCGLGLDAAWMAREGSCVALADVNSDTIAVASRLLRRAGLEPCGAALIRGEWPYVDPGIPIDTFYASGVLHHIPYAASVIRRAAELVGPGGSIRAMLYGRAARDRFDSDGAFLRGMDSVGAYSTWYDADKIRAEWGEWADLDYCEPITADGTYLAAHLYAR